MGSEMCIRDRWQELGAGYLSIENRQAGLKTAGDHIEAMRRFKEATGLKF